MKYENVQRVAIIGCGFFAPNHIHAWRSLSTAKIVAVCDLNASRAAAAADLAGGAPVYTDARHMLNEQQPHVVDIITTASSHLPLATLCAASGIPTIIQKPLALNLEEATAIVRISNLTHVRMMVHENFRFQQPMQEIKRILDAGEIGSPQYCRICFRCGYDIFSGQSYLRETDRLILMDNGVHVFDVARFLMGEISNVSCRTRRVRPDIRGEDMATALVGFEQGATGVVECSYSSFLPSDPFPETLVTVEGDRGSIVLERRYQLSIRSGESVRTYSVEPEVPVWGHRPWHVVQDSVVRTCRHYLDVAAGRAPLQTSVQDNIKTLAVLEACYRSASRNGALQAPVT